jgi:CubicO group peptidase (beta-lactamase class C family)
LAELEVLREIDGPVEDTMPAVRAITLRDLLTFTFGSGAHFGPSPFNDMAASLQLGVGPPQPQLAPVPDEWMRRFSTLPLMCQPGERWLYHTGAEILGVLIARASGQTFESFLEERVFGPLGMVDTAFAVSPEKLGRFTAGYFTDPVSGDFGVFDEIGGQWSRPPAFPSGAAGLVSTGPDYLAFAEVLLRGGAPLLARSSVEVMTTDHLTPAQKAISGFAPGEFDAKGFGFCVSVVTRHDHPAAPIGQYGWGGGLGSIWRNDPAEQMSCILLTNSAWSAPHAPPVAQDMLTAAYAAIVD